MLFSNSNVSRTHNISNIFKTFMTPAYNECFDEFIVIIKFCLIKESYNVIFPFAEFL